MAGPTTQIFTGQTGAANVSFNPQRVREENGIVTVQFIPGGTATFTLRIQGRSEPGAPYFTIITITEASVDANGLYAQIVEEFPNMRFSLAAIGAGSSINAWMME